MALSTIKVFMHIRADTETDKTKHDAKKALRKLSGALTLTLEEADVVVFHNGSTTVFQNALGLRKPLVSPEWLTACKNSGKCVEYTPFLLADSNASARVIKAVMHANSGAAVMTTDDDTPAKPPPPSSKSAAVPRVLLDDSLSQNPPTTALTTAEVPPPPPKAPIAAVAEAAPTAQPLKCPPATKLSSAKAAAAPKDIPTAADDDDNPYLCAAAPAPPASPSRRRKAMPAAAPAASAVPAAPPITVAAPVQQPVSTARKLLDDDDDDEALLVPAAAAGRASALAENAAAKKSIAATTVVATTKRGRPAAAAPKVAAQVMPADDEQEPRRPQPPAEPPVATAAVVRGGRGSAPAVGRRGGRGAASAPQAAIIPGSACTGTGPSPRAIAFSGVEDRDTLRGVVVALGSKVVDDVFGRTGAKPTHLVVEGATLSPKILLALCLGIPILTPHWILASLCEGRWIPLDDDAPSDFYCPLFDRASHEQRAALVKQRDRRMLETGPARGPQFLEGLTLYFAGKSAFPTNHEFQELVQLAGADVVRTPEATGLSAVIDMSESLHAAGPAPGSSSQSPSRRGAPKLDDIDAPIIRRQWIVDSIVKCAALPFGDYLVNEPSPSTTTANKAALTAPANTKINGKQRRGAAAATAAATAAAAAAAASKQASAQPNSSPTLKQQQQAKAAATAAGASTPGVVAVDAITLALQKRSPGPPSAVKSAQNQWSTQQLRESLSPSRDGSTSSSDDDDSDASSDSSIDD